MKYKPYFYDNYWRIISEKILNKVIRKDIFPSYVKPYFVNLELERIIRTRISKEFSTRMEKNVILDEGIIVAISRLDYIDIEENCFEKSALPDIAIFIKADMDTIVNVAETRIKKE